MSEQQESQRADDGAPVPREGSGQGAGAREPASDAATSGTAHLAPRYLRFIGVGIALGLVVALVLRLAGAGSDDPNAGVAWLMTGLGLALIGALLGGLAAVVADARS